MLSAGNSLPISEPLRILLVILAFRGSYPDRPIPNACKSRHAEETVGNH